MYASESVQNEPITVSGFVIVPKSSPSAGGYRVVSVAHGTVGLDDSCAPTLSAASLPPKTNELLDRGLIVAATDYRGLGPPGLLPYLVGVSAARDTINIVRATQHLVSDVSSNYVVIGYSEGGQAAMFASHIAAVYARAR
jgi:dipeptidyl aminopeptidase/acylaminoacyl peptidase